MLAVAVTEFEPRGEGVDIPGQNGADFGCDAEGKVEYPPAARSCDALRQVGTTKIPIKPVDQFDATARSVPCGNPELPIAPVGFTRATEVNAVEQRGGWYRKIRRQSRCLPETRRRNPALQITFCGFQ